VRVSQYTCAEIRYERLTLCALISALILLGHPYMIMLVLLVQILVYREVTALFNIPGRPSVTGGSNKPGAYSNTSSRAGSAVQSEDDDDDEMGGREGRRKEELWSKTLSW
jgi:phosphatidate cytidylyltransferase